MSRRLLHHGPGHHEHGHGHHDHHGHHGHHGMSPEQMEQAKEAALIVNQVMIVALFALCFAALVWAIFERKRRRRLATEAGGFPSRSGDYVTGLFECIGTPRICFPAFCFTPILAAFNRSAADKRDCSIFDVCFSLKTHFTQYHTRQSIRAEHRLEEMECGDCVSTVCCLPCAVGQDALEMERRAAAAPVAPAAAAEPAVVGVMVVPGMPSKAEYSKVEMVQV